MRFSLYIAKRYLFTKSSNNAINIITGIAATGVIVGALALFVVLSGFAGLKEFSLQFSNVFDPDLKVAPKTGKTFFVDDETTKKLQNSTYIKAYAPIIEERVFLNFKGRNTIAYIKGVDESYKTIIETDSILLTGQWLQQQENYVVVGSEISRTLSLGTFDYSDLLEMYVPTPGTGQITDPTKAFRRELALVSGLYHVNEELNAKYVFAPKSIAQQLLDFKDDEVSTLELVLRPDVSEEEATAWVSSLFNDEVHIKNRIQQNDALYKMLNTENLAVYLIFTLVLIIALFNVVGSIIMMILDKKENAKTLYNLGATIKEIRHIFFLQGLLMTFLGGLLGVVLGVVLVWMQQEFQWVMITSTLPYPVKIELMNVFVVLITINILGIVASKIAASRVNTSLVEQH